MTREEKKQEVSELKEMFSAASVLYITDSSALTVEQSNDFRRKCFESDIKFRVAKNTLIKRAMDDCETDYEGLYEVLKGTSSIMMAEVANAPAKLLKEFRKGNEKPILKAAFIDSDVYLGDDQIKALASLKSKEELLGEIVGLLQSPIKNVVGALQSGGNKLSGLVKALSEKGE